jgi:hypothetical protein
MGNRASMAEGEQPMDDRDLYDRGLKLRTEIFGRDAVEKRMNAFG